MLVAGGQLTEMERTMGKQRTWLLATAGLILGLNWQACATTNWDLVVDLTTKKVTSTNAVAFRETVTVVLLGTASYSSNALELQMLDGGTVVAVCTNLTAAGTNSAGGTMSLNTVPLAEAFTNEPATKVKNFAIGVWDTTTGRLLVNDKVQVMNNPYVPGAPAPEVLNGFYYLTLADWANNSNALWRALFATSTGLCRGGWRNPVGFSISIRDYPRGAVDSTAYVTNGDMIQAIVSRGVTKFDKLFQPEISHAGTNTTILLTAWPTNVASVSNLFLTHLTDGVVTCAVAAADGPGCSYTNTFTLTTDASTTTNAYGAISNSARFAAVAALDNLLTNGAPDVALFSTLDNATQTYVRNTNCWAQSLDTTPAMVWYDGWSTDCTWMGATLISPRHFVAAHHFPNISPGRTVYFCTTGNVTVSRTVTGLMNVTNDLDVGLLDSDLPATISYCRVITNNLTKLPSAIAGLPALVVDKFNRAQAWDAATQAGGIYTIAPSTATNRAAAWRGLETGDSGHPALFYFGGVPVLLGGFWWISGGSAPGEYLSALNAAMLALGGTNQATVVDLSSYTSF